MDNYAIFAVASGVDPAAIAILHLSRLLRNRAKAVQGKD
jgi:hypothetical protein